MTTQHLLSLCQAILPTYDGRGPDPTAGAHAILHGGTPSPAGLNLNHEHAQTAHAWQVVCVSNNPTGARIIADRLTRAVDSQPAPGHPHDRYEVTHASPPIEDRDDPTTWRWTTTVEVHLTTGR